MSGGGFTLSFTSKILLSLGIIVLFVFSSLSFLKAFPFDNILTSILWLLLGLALLLLGIILTILVLISK
jgi:hypothetical protein